MINGQESLARIPRRIKTSRRICEGEVDRQPRSNKMTVREMILPASLGAPMR